MHFEVLVEDASGKIALEAILPKILGRNGEAHSFRIIAYKGVGQLPKGLRDASEARHRILLARLPRLLRGYGNSLQAMAETAAVVVVVDLDQRDCMQFKNELLALVAGCHPAPQVLFRIAIEELEAWFMGDQAAVVKAYPRARKAALENYVQDSVCGTWESLAEAIHEGGAKKLKKQGWPAPGKAKCDWAREIAPRMNVERNLSKSFQVFRDGMRRLVDAEE